MELIELNIIYLLSIAFLRKVHLALLFWAKVTFVAIKKSITNQIRIFVIEWSIYVTLCNW